MRSSVKVLVLMAVAAIVLASACIVFIPREAEITVEGEGTVTPSGQVKLGFDQELTVSIDPAEGWSSEVFSDGVSVAVDVSEYKFRLGILEFSKHIRVVFSEDEVIPEPEPEPLPTEYTLNVTANEGGTVSPLGSAVLPAGSVQCVTMESSPGYVISEVTLDGSRMGPLISLDVTMDSDHRVDVVFREVSEGDIPVTIDVNVQVDVDVSVPITLGNADMMDFGRVEPSGTVYVAPGGSLKVSVYLNDGYSIRDFVVDGVSRGPVTTCVIDDIHESVTVGITVSKTVPGFRVTASAGTGGTITPSGTIDVAQGDDITFTLTPRGGYQTWYVNVDGVTRSVQGGTFTLTDVQGPHTVEAVFHKLPDPVTLTGLDISRLPDKTDYFEGETFDPAGMVVRAMYSNGSSTVLVPELYTYSPTGPLSAADTHIVVSYTDDGETANAMVSIEVKKIELTGIHVRYQPHKTAYHVGETFDPEGMHVVADYNNGFRHLLEDGDYTYSPTGPLKKTDTSVTVSYMGRTASVPITVEEETAAIKVTHTGKTGYNHGDTFDTGGMVVVKVMSDGSEKEVTGYTVEPSILYHGTDHVTVSYDGKTARLDVTVRDLTGLEATSPDKTDYFVGQTFVPVGMSVFAVFEGSVKVQVSMDECVFTPAVDLKATDAYVTISYTVGDRTVTATVDITVSEVAITGLRVSPDSLVFGAGEVFDKSQVSVTAVYNNGDVRVIAAGEYTVSPDRPLRTSDTTVTIGYGGQTADVKVKVNAVNEYLVVSGDFKRTYFHGETFDTTGMKVQAVDSDGSYSDLTEYSVAPTQLSSSTEKVTVSAGGLTADVPVTVNPRLLSVSAEGTYKDAYFEGDAFDPTGLAVTASYNDGSTSPLDVNDCLYTPAVLASTGTVKVSYTENGVTAETTVDVTVEPLVLTGITVDKAPDRTSYHAGESFDPAGMVVTAHYNSGGQKTVSGTAGSGPLSESDTSVEISYTEGGVTAKTAVDVTVGPKAPVGLSVSGTFKTDYKVGESFDPTGMTATVAYTDGTETSVGAGSLSFVPGTDTVLDTGDSEVKVSYAENGITVRTAVSITVSHAVDVSVTVDTVKTVVEGPDGTTSTSEKTPGKPLSYFDKDHPLFEKVFYPGLKQEVSMTVTNGSTMPMHTQIYLDNFAPSTGNALTGAMRMAVSVVDVSKFDGTLDQLIDGGLAVDLGTLEPGEIWTVKVVYGLPGTADDTVQNQGVRFDLVLRGEGSS